MFCPECRAEYRPGFTHCSDCDVDLVIELPGANLKTLKRRAGLRVEHLPTLKKIYTGGRKTVHSGYWIRSALAFVMHQIIATEGVIWLTVLGTFLLRGSIAQVHEAWAHSAFMRGMHLILTNTPFFPIQIATGAYLGWRLYRRWGHRSMLWVWILPGIVLTYAVIAIPTFSPWSLFPQTGPLSHYFGWGCQADYRCYDQLTFTQPFYTSVAYCLGALWASQTTEPSLCEGWAPDASENQGVKKSSVSVRS